jgi:hypothetical protein
MRPLGATHFDGGGAVSLPRLPWLSEGGRLAGLKEWATPTLPQTRRRALRLERPAVRDEAAEFAELADTWERETRLYSFPERKAMHPAYQEIIGMGPQALPLILRRLEERGPDHWYWALAAITRKDPAAEATTMQEAADAWLAWGREQSNLHAS